jgi:CRP-like cAMP-binding protein
MLYLIERYGVDKQGVRARVPFSITRDELGKMVGARLETVVRVLGNWKRAGWLDSRADGFHVMRTDKLRDLIAHTGAD